MNQKTNIFAQLHERFLARLIDGIITLPITLMLAQFFANAPALAAISTFVFGVGYVALFQAGKWQATPGKRLVGLSVWNKNNTPLSLKESVARELAVLMPTYPIYVSFIDPETARVLVIALSFWWFGQALMSDQRTAMHDTLCATRVKVLKL